MKKGIKFLIFILIIIIIIGAFSLYKYSDLFLLNNITIMNNNRVDSIKLAEYISDKNIKFFDLDKYELEEFINSYPCIRESHIKKGFPNKIEVVINERIPVVSVFYAEQYLLVDEDLVVIDVVKEKPNYLYEISYKFENFHIGKKINDQKSFVLKNAVDLVFLINSLEFEFHPDIIIKDGNINTIISDDISANFGDGENMESRFNSMISIYENMKKDGIEKGCINVSHDGYPTLEMFEEGNWN